MFTADEFDSFLARVPEDVLVVLDEVMKHRRPAPGTKSVLAAMGPGFCAEMLLLEW